MTREFCDRCGTERRAGGEWYWFQADFRVVAPEARLGYLTQVWCDACHKAVRAGLTDLFLACGPGLK